MSDLQSIHGTRESGQRNTEDWPRLLERIICFSLANLEGLYSQFRVPTGPWNSKSRGNSWNLQLTPENSWNLELTPGNSWNLELTPGNSWNLELTPGKYWNLELTPGNSWNLELTPGNSWNLELTPGNS